MTSRVTKRIKYIEDLKSLWRISTTQHKLIVKDFGDVQSIFIHEISQSPQRTQNAAVITCPVLKPSTRYF